MEKLIEESNNKTLQLLNNKKFIQLLDIYVNDSELLENLFDFLQKNIDYKNVDILQNNNIEPNIKFIDIIYENNICKNKEKIKETLKKYSNHLNLTIKSLITK